MRITLKLILAGAALLLSAGLIHAQDLSKYRNFSFGMPLAELSSQVDAQPLHTKLIHSRPAVIQEVTWWPADATGAVRESESVWQALFTFYNGQLYRILVTYDHTATRGLSAEDMVQAISAKYGTAVRPDSQISFPTNELYTSTEKVIARWENAEYSFNLFRSSFLNAFGLVMFSKKADAEIRAAIAESLRLQEDLQQAKKELDRQKKEVINLEEARQVNKKIFRP